MNADATKSNLDSKMHCIHSEHIKIQTEDIILLIMLIIGQPYFHYNCLVHNLKKIDILFWGNYVFLPQTTTRLPFAPMNYQFYITLHMNYYFVTKYPPPLVKDVKSNGQLYCSRHCSVSQWHSSRYSSCMWHVGHHV